MIRHRNYYEMAAVVDDIPSFHVPADTHAALPAARPQLRAADAPRSGLRRVHARVLRRPAPGRRVRMLAVRPTILPSVPRVYEKAHSAVLAKLDEAHGAAEGDRRWALDVGREVSRAPAGRAGRCPRWLALRHRIADRLVYSKVKERFGGRLRLAISGGAPLSPEIIEFFHALDILDPRGLRPHRVHDRLLGEPPRPLQVRHGRPAAARDSRRSSREDGELLLRSETVFAGYLKDEEATRAVLDDDGWLRTGDIAEIDEDGLHQDHRPEEGHPRHGRRQERRSAEPGERAQGVEVRLAGESSSATDAPTSSR